MDSCLTQIISVQLPPWQRYSKAPEIPGYTQITSLTPIVESFYGSMPESEGQFLAKDLFGKVLQFEGSGRCGVMTAQRKPKKAFCKVTHLLDPIRYIQSYYHHSEKGEERKQKKLANSRNQAFVDALGSYLVSQLKERNLSPHFCQFYGGFQAVADIYRYDISSEFESFRKYRPFWDNRRKGLFKLHLEIEDDDLDNDNNEDDKENFGWLTETPKSSLQSGGFSYKTPASKHTDRTHISLASEVLDLSGDAFELESVNSFPSEEHSSDSPDESIHKSSSDTDSKKAEEDDDDITTYMEDSLQMFAEFKDFPVMMIFQEEMTAPLDDLLEDEEEVGAEVGTQEWEDHWTAWTFQILAALSVAQGVLGFTHNDLHTNNIVWKDTDLPYLYYRARDGSVFRVPTYGKLFCIIDFGRAIFRVGDHWFISDDYEIGGDAEGQYNFGPQANSKKPTLYPNPSFDLCRYAVSVIDGIFPQMPAEDLDGALLNKEGTWEVHETESPLWNLLWSWLIDDEDRNVLRDEDGTERFPDFDLYQHISTSVHNAKPQDAIFKPLFQQYKIKDKDVPEWETVYPLFC